MKTWKRVTSVLLSAMLLLGLLPCSVVGVSAENPQEVVQVPTKENRAETAADGMEITRAQWLQRLVKTFDMTVEDEIYPDNYFSDLKSDSEYYYDMLLAVQFGLIDVAAGEAMCPDDPATREFAAHTMNFCIGYQLDENAAYTFTEADAVKYKDDIQISVNRGWFALVGGGFLPEQPITAEESEKMLADAVSVLESTVVDENYQSVYEFTENIIEIPNGTDVTVDSEAGIVTIKDCHTVIANGNLFAVYVNGIPLAFKAISVKTVNGVTTVQAQKLESEEAFNNIDAQGVVDADITEFEAADGTTVVWCDEETEETFYTAKAARDAYQARGTKTLNKSITVKTEIKNAGFAGSIETKLKNTRIEYDVKASKGIAYVRIIADTETSYKGTFDAAEFGSYSDIPLGAWPVGGIGSVVLSIHTSLKGSVAGVEKGRLTVGVQYDKSYGFRFQREFRANSFNLSLEVSGSVGIKLKLVVFDLPIISGNVYGEVGAKGEVTAAIFDDGKKPEKCVNFAAYLYVKVGVQIKLKLDLGYENSYSAELAVYDKENSPIRVQHHYEDGVETLKCSRKGSVDINGNVYNGICYNTCGDSYYGGGLYGYGGSGGWGANGNPIVIYEYSLDEDENLTITKYNGNATALVIPDTIDGYTVVGIGEGAFYGNINLRSVIIPDTVTYIEKNAFEGCRNLSTVKLSKKLETLGGFAFGYCTALKTIEIPKALKEAYEYSKWVNHSNGSVYESGGPFAESGLKSVTFEEGTTHVASQLFHSAHNLVNVNFINTITSIGYYSFCLCGNLPELNLPENLTVIGEGAFQSCVSLTQLSLPDSVVSIGNSAFEDCRKLSTVKLPKKLETLGGFAFGYCTALKEIEIPKALKTANEYSKWVSHSDGNVYESGGPFAESALESVAFEAGTTGVVSNLFRSAHNLVNVKWIDSMTSVGNYSFCLCWKLPELNLSANISTIGEGAFQECNSLTDVKLPNSVMYIKIKAFEGCKNLSSVELSKNLEYLGGFAFGYCAALEEIKIPKSLKTAAEYSKWVDHAGELVYESGGPFAESGLKRVSFEKGTTSVLTNLFKSAHQLEEADLVDGMTEIGEYSFWGCNALVKIKLPEGITSIGNQAFNGCSSLPEIIIPNTVNAMGTYTFANCKSMTKAVLPNIRMNVTEGTFENCSSLKDITLPKTVTAIRAYAFKNCSALEQLVLPDGLTVIETEAFRNSGLRNIEIPNNCTTVGDGAFRDSLLLNSVHLGDGVASFGIIVFYNCPMLTDVKLGIGLTKIPEYTFAACEKLESIVIPYRVTSIGEYAFSNDVAFRSITIPRATTSIAANAFSYPANMTIYGVAGTYAETYANEKEMTFVNKVTNAVNVTVAPNTLTISKGVASKLIMNVTPADFTDTVSWKSSDTSVVSIDDAGNLKAVGLGTATIKLIVGDVSASCKVTVVQPVTSISLSNTTVSIDALSKYQLTARINPDNAANKVLKWSSSDEKIATVDANGLVTAHAKGNAIITAIATDGSEKSASCTVTVTNTAYVVSSGAELESPHNYENNCSDFWLYTVPGAQSVSLTFDECTNIEDGFDFICIYNANGSFMQRYTGDELAAKTVDVPGDTVKIKLISDDSGNEWGFKVTKINGVSVEAPADKIIVMKKEQINAYVDGQVLPMTDYGNGNYAIAKSMNGTYALPLRCIGEAFDMRVDYLGGGRTKLTNKAGDYVVALRDSTILEKYDVDDNLIMSFNAEFATFTDEAGITYVPMRAVSEALGLGVSYVGSGTTGHGSYVAISTDLFLNLKPEFVFAEIEKAYTLGL